MQHAQEVCGEGSIFELKKFHHKKVGIVTTGNEVYHGRIEDKFTPVLKAKLAEYDTELIGHRISDDNPERVTGFIQELLESGAGLVLCSGGMSVDPDDRTPFGNSEHRSRGYYIWSAGTSWCNVYVGIL